jgi:hypothetical protein
MSMYARILDTVMEGRTRPDSGPTTGEALSNLVRCRARLHSVAPCGRRADWATTALADQLAYDVALIALAGCVGIACTPGAFERPEVGRAELNQALAARGVDLDELEATSSGAAGR